MLTAVPDTPHRINRNILECKVSTIWRCSRTSHVLIETYWNVKYVKRLGTRDGKQVLIETYWNVKEDPPDHRRTGRHRINRNILECKGRINRNTIIIKQVLIETYWNVKLYSNGRTFIFFVVLIETYWNVKETTSRFRVRTGRVLIETYWNVKRDFTSEPWMPVSY